MTSQAPEPPPRRKWHLHRWLVVFVAGMLAYGAWTEYAFRSALKQADALAWKVYYTDPVEVIRADWKAAFTKETWLDGVMYLDDIGGKEFQEHCGIVHRLNPKHLEIYDAPNLPDLSALKGLTRLESLTISDGHNLTNVDALTSLPALRQVKLFSCIALANVDAFKGLKALETVELFNCTALTNVNALKNLTGLKVLQLDGCTGLLNVDALKGLSALESLDLNRCTGLTNVNPLMDLTTLKKISLIKCTGLSKESITALRMALPKTTIWAD